jgi:two-component system, chemotaxis family, CheB/CheR fusion protein
MVYTRKSVRLVRALFSSADDPGSRECTTGARPLGAFWRSAASLAEEVSYAGWGATARNRLKFQRRGRPLVAVQEASDPRDEGGVARESDFEDLLEYLRERRGFDFTSYKRGSIQRRVDERMRDRCFIDYALYRDHLEADPDEFTRLFNAILVSATSFFRDRDSWEMLRTTALPQLLAASPAAPMKVWSAGCATGEEVYSLAMVFADALGVDGFLERVTIVGTDVDEKALSTARWARYTEQDFGNVSQKDRDTYFTAVGDGAFVFRPDLRRRISFDRRNLLTDPPVSGVDLLACRNTMMYFTAESQKRALDLFHAALNDTGVLFLGRAEVMLTRNRLFTPIELKSRIFQKTPAPAAKQPAPR